MPIYISDVVLSQLSAIGKSEELPNQSYAGIIRWLIEGYYTEKQRKAEGKRRQKEYRERKKGDVTLE